MSDSTGSEHDQHQKFFDVFGVSEDDLRDRGIDPGQYARDNIGRALKDQRKWALVLPRSSQLAILWTRWGWRGFAVMFVGIGFLVLSKLDSLHIVGIAGASVMWLLAAVMYAVTVRYRLQYRRACRLEGIEPSWRHRRDEIEK